MPVDVYVDQPVFSEAARMPDWRTHHELGELLALFRTGAIRLRPSQAHFTETLINVDVDEDAGCVLRPTERRLERQSIARVIVECCDLAAPLPTWETLVVGDVARFVARAIPEAVSAEGLADLDRIAAAGVSAKLRLLAADADFHAPDFYQHAWSRKLQTQLAQNAPRDPAYLAALIEAVRSNTKLQRTIYDPFDTMPLPQLRRYVAQALERLRGVEARGAQKLWGKHREILERSYAIDDTLATIEHFAKSAEPLPHVLNLATVLQGWPRIEARLGRPLPLPPPLPDVAAARQQGWQEEVFVGKVAQALVETMIDASLLTTSRTAVYAACLQIDRALGGARSTTGAVFDCEHALALHQVDVFYTYDGELASIARTVAKRVTERAITGLLECRRAASCASPVRLPRAGPLANRRALESAANADFVPERILMLTHSPHAR